MPATLAVSSSRRSMGASRWIRVSMSWLSVRGTSNPIRSTGTCNCQPEGERVTSPRSTRSSNIATMKSGLPPDCSAITVASCRNSGLPSDPRHTP